MQTHLTIRCRATDNPCVHGTQTPYYVLQHCPQDNGLCRHTWPEDAELQITHVCMEPRPHTMLFNTVHKTMVYADTPDQKIQSYRWLMCAWNPDARIHSPTLSTRQWSMQTHLTRRCRATGDPCVHGTQTSYFILQHCPQDNTLCRHTWPEGAELQVNPWGSCHEFEMTLATSRQMGASVTQNQNTDRQRWSLSQFPPLSGIHTTLQTKFLWLFHAFSRTVVHYSMTMTDNFMKICLSSTKSLKISLQNFLTFHNFFSHKIFISNSVLSFKPRSV